MKPRKSKAAIYGVRLSSGVAYFVGAVHPPPLPYEVIDHAQFEFKKLSSPRLLELARRFDIDGGFLIHGTAVFCTNCAAQFYDCEPSEFSALVNGPCPECGRRAMKPHYLAWRAIGPE